jgi:hypothetical protein
MVIFTTALKPFHHHPSHILDYIALLCGFLLTNQALSKLANLTGKRYNNPCLLVARIAVSSSGKYRAGVPEHGRREPHTHYIFCRSYPFVRKYRSDLFIAFDCIDYVSMSEGYRYAYPFKPEQYLIGVTLQPNRGEWHE